MPDRSKRATTVDAVPRSLLDETTIRALVNAYEEAMAAEEAEEWGMPEVRPFFIVTPTPDEADASPSEDPADMPRRMPPTAGGSGPASLVGRRIRLGGEAHVFLGFTLDGRGAFAKAAGFDRPACDMQTVRFESGIHTATALGAAIPSHRVRGDRRGRWGRRS